MNCSQFAIGILKIPTSLIYRRIFTAIYNEGRNNKEANRQRRRRYKISDAACDEYIGF